MNDVCTALRGGVTQKNMKRDSDKGRGSETSPNFVNVIYDDPLVGKGGGWNRMRANYQPTKGHNGERRKSMERPACAHIHAQEDLGFACG